MKTAGELLRQVDWGRTRAYALGLSGIYLNMKGREDAGSRARLTRPSQFETALAEGFDGAGGQPAARGSGDSSSTAPRDGLQWPVRDRGARLLVDFAEGYRVSWSSSMGGVAENQIEDNVKKWSGDHIVDPELVPGVLFMNRPFREQGARLVDLAPTILAALGVPKGPAMEGESLLP